MDRYRRYTKDPEVLKKVLLVSTPLSLSSKQKKSSLPLTPMPPTIHKYHRMPTKQIKSSASRLQSSSGHRREGDLLIRSTPAMGSRRGDAKRPFTALGPTTGGKELSERLSNFRGRNIEVLLMHKPKQNCEQFIQEYLRRHGLPVSSKLFILNGPFEYVRRCLLHRGWIENKNNASQAFHLKWTHTDTDADYEALRSPQVFNHIYRNRQLTTKNGLCKNLRHFPDYFPRSYDLADSSHIADFKKDYEKICVINIIRSHASYFRDVGLELSVDIELVILAIHYCHNLVENLKDNCAKMKKYPFMKEEERHFTLSTKLRNDLVEYSELPFPFVESRPHWEKPSPMIAREVIAMADLIIANVPNCQAESHNVWIIKPGSSSKGSGVRCVKGLQEILSAGNQLQARIVQKYIERPLLLPGKFKFDIRQWVLVTSFDPLTVYFFNNNYARVCQLSFNLDNLDNSRHVANYSVQKHLTGNQEKTVLSLVQIKEFLQSIDKDWDRDVLPMVHSLVVQTLLAVSDKMQDVNGCFELYGFDLLIDEDCKPWLLEVNLSPACAERTPWLKQMLDDMIEGLFKIVVDNEHFGEPILRDFNCETRQLSVIEKGKRPKQNWECSDTIDHTANTDTPNDSEHNSIPHTRQTPNRIKKKRRKGKTRIGKSGTNQWVLLYRGNCKGEDTKKGISLEIVGEKFNIKKERAFEKRFLMEKAAFVIQKNVREFLRRVKIKRCSLIIQRLLRRKIACNYLNNYL